MGGEGCCCCMRQQAPSQFVAVKNQLAQLLLLADWHPDRLQLQTLLPCQHLLVATLLLGQALSGAVAMPLILHEVTTSLSLSKGSCRVKYWRNSEVYREYEMPWRPSTTSCTTKWLHVSVVTTVKELVEPVVYQIL